MESGWIEDLILEENLRKKLHDIGSGRGFFGYDTKSTSHKSKTNQWDCVKLKGSVQQRTPSTK